MSRLESPVPNPDVSNVEVPQLFDYFAYLEDWLKDPTQGEPVYKFLEPILRLGKGVNSNEMAPRIATFVSKLFEKVELDDSAQQLDKYKPFFLEACSALHEAIFFKKGMLTRWQRGSTEGVVAPLMEQYIAQMDVFFQEAKQHQDVVPIVHRIYYFLLLSYAKAYGEQALEKLSPVIKGFASATIKIPESASEGVNNGISLIVAQWAREPLLEKFTLAVNKLQTTDEWKNRDFMRDLTSFLNTRDPAHIANFVSRIFYIISRFEMSSKKPLGADQLPEIYEVAIELGLLASRENKQLDLKTLETIFATLRILEEILESEVMEDGELLHQIVGKLRENGEEKFRENKLRLLSEVSSKIENNMEMLTSNYFRRILDFVRVLAQKISKEIIKEGKLISPLREGLGAGVEGNTRFKTDASLFVAQLQQDVTRKAHEGNTWRTLTSSPEEDKDDEQAKREENTTIPQPKAVKPSLLARIKERWQLLKRQYKALPLGWKILAGVVIFLGVAAIIAAGVFFPPSLVITLPTGTIAASVLVMVGGATLVAFTAGAHVAHTAQQSVAPLNPSTGQATTNSFRLRSSKEEVTTKSFRLHSSKGGVTTKPFRLRTPKKDTPKKEDITTNRFRLRSSGREEIQRASLTRVDVFSEAQRKKTANKDPVIQDPQQTKSFGPH